MDLEFAEKWIIDQKLKRRAGWCESGSSHGIKDGMQGADCQVGRAGIGIPGRN